MSTDIIGQNQTTPGNATFPTKIVGDNTTTTLLTIKAGSATPPTGQVAVRIRKPDGTVVWQMTWDDGLIAYNMLVASSWLLFDQKTGIDGRQDPPCFALADKASANQMRWWMDNGAPGAGTVGAAQVDDIYTRNDGVAGTSAVYRCTVAGTGAASTWVVIG